MTELPSRRDRRRRALPALVGIHPAVLIAAVVAIVVVVVWGFVMLDRNAVGLDVWLNDRHTPGVDAAARTVATLFAPAFAVPVGIVFAAIVAWCRRSILLGLGAGLAVGIAWISSYAVKLIVDRPRPDFALIAHRIVPAETDPSFPSGHTTFITCLAVVTVLLVWRHAGWRALAIVLGALAIVAVGLLRMYVGVHDLNDVAASALYGMAAATLLFAFVGWGVETVRLRRGTD